MSVNYYELIMFVPLSEQDETGPAFYVGVHLHKYYAETVLRDGSTSQLQEFDTFHEAVIECGNRMAKEKAKYTIFKER